MHDSHDTLNAITRAIALYLPNYSATTPASLQKSRFARLENVAQEGNCLGVSYVPGNMKRLHIGSWMHEMLTDDVRGRVTLERGDSITVAADRDAADIAREIQRRLLPQHIEAYVKNALAVEAARAYRAQLQKSIALAHAAFPVPSAWKFSDRVDLPNLDRYSSEAPGVGSVQVGTTYVNVEITVSPEQAQRLAQFVATLAAETAK